MRQIEIGLLGALSVKNAGVSFNPNCFLMAVRDCIHCPKRKPPVIVAHSLPRLSALLLVGNGKLNSAILSVFGSGAENLQFAQAFYNNARHAISNADAED
jgi:hypothetical protein